jgi:glycosyltransferase involved in cell wall biosynthesis
MIVCGNVYPLFDETKAGFIGGMETRAALLGRGLAATGRWAVSFVVESFGQPSFVRREGIDFHTYRPVYRPAARNVYPRFRRRRWFPALNLDRRDLSLVWQIPLVLLFRLFPPLFFPLYWRQRRPDVVCCFGNNDLSAEVIADCHRLGVRTVLCIAADIDVSADYRPEDLTLNDYSVPKWMGHYALETADHIFVQTEHQRRALAERFGRKGQVVRNPVAISADDPDRWPAREDRDVVLWIGRSDTYHKQPLLFLELALRCPDIPFLMVVNNKHADVFETLQSRRPPNLTIVERVAHKDIWDYYRRARAFVSTSAYEGFPNTFLQCAAAGVPVASLAVDPEGVLTQHGCGLLANGSLDALEAAVRSLWESPDLAERYARTFHAYALSHHGMDGQVRRFDALLQEVVATPLPRPTPWWRLPRRRFVRRHEA